MNFQSSFISFLLFSPQLISFADCKYIKQYQSEAQKGTNGLSPHMSLVEFQSMLYSEINSEIEILQQEQDPPHNSTPHHQGDRLRGRYLREEDVIAKAQEVWDEIVQHGWDMSQVSHKSYQKRDGRNLKEETDDSSYPMISPFLVCSHTSQEKSGYQRLQPMLEFTGAHLRDYIVVRNDPDKTCYHISLEYETAQKIVESIESSTDSLVDGSDRYTLVPLTDLMKIQLDTMDMISEDSWTVPAKSSPDDWERMVRVGLSTGHRVNLDEKSILDTANGIIDDIQSLGKAGTQNRRRLLLLQDDKEHKEEESPPPPVTSLSDLFSLTASNHKNTINQGNQNLRKLSSSPHWSRSLELGLEADHSCQVMFKMLHVNVHYDNEGFDIIFNHNGGIEDGMNNINDDINDGIEQFELDLQCENEAKCSSASNKHCITSLVMALSTHPLVLSVESEGPILADDYEAQWITQSRVEGKRPLRDIGINGTNQIISIIDSGLDIHHKYFGPSDEKIYKVSSN